MIIDTIADIDTRIVNARWRLLHCGWEANIDEVELARVAIDVLLERRYEIMQAAPAAPAPTVAAPTVAAPTVAAPTVAAPTVAAPASADEAAA